ncbi:MAG: transcriptional regulator, partial [Halobacteriaceae archaeon]
ETSVREAIDGTAARTGDPMIRYVSSDAPIENARRSFRDAPEGAGLIIDPVDPLEREDETRFGNFLNDLKNHVTNTGGTD